MDRAIAAEECADGYTACLLGDPIGCAGVTMHGHGVGEVWAMFSPLLRTMPKSLFKSVSQGLNEIIAERQPRELFARADQEDETAQRFLEHLGFTMDAFLYKRTF